MSTYVFLYLYSNLVLCKVSPQAVHEFTPIVSGDDEVIKKKPIIYFHCNNFSLFIIDIIFLSQVYHDLI